MSGGGFLVLKMVTIGVYGFDIETFLQATA